MKLTSPGPVLFRQRRVGRDGQDFDLLKFRSMRVAPERRRLPARARAARPAASRARDRRTPIGRFLRRSALDELPQLFNVLKGEMSLVGPRPERPEFVELFGRDHDRYSDRHRVKSGITGWAQVTGCAARPRSPTASSGTTTTSRTGRSGSTSRSCCSRSALCFAPAMTPDPAPLTATLLLAPAVVHDWLTVPGGSEKVVLELLATAPAAPRSSPRSTTPGRGGDAARRPHGPHVVPEPPPGRAARTTRSCCR